MGGASVFGHEHVSRDAETALPADAMEPMDTIGLTRTADWLVTARRSFRRTDDVVAVATTS
ncbi:MAG: hypothetical protein AAFO01_02410, partial [Pseudomonadota bacterium]